MYELSANNDNVILFDKRNQKHYVLDTEDVDQLVDNDNKLRSDEIIEKYLKFKNEPVVVHQQLKNADIKAEYEAMRELYEPKVSTQIIDNFINKFKLSNDELRKLEAFPDSKTIDTFNRDEVEKNNMKKEFKLMFERLKKDPNIKTDPFLYLKFYFGTKIIKSDNVFIQQQLGNLLNEPWKYADQNYITQEEIENLKRHSPYKNLASLVYSVRRPVFDGINFMKILTLLKIYSELKRKYFNNNIGKFKSIFTDYNKNEKYLNFNIWSKHKKSGEEKDKIMSFSVKNRILYILNIKGFKIIDKKENFKDYLKIITPKIYAIIKYLLISDPIENPYKITINLFDGWTGSPNDEVIFTDTHLIYKIEKVGNEVKQIQIKNKNTYWNDKTFEQTIKDFKEYVRMSDTERNVKNELIDLMDSNDSTQDSDSSDDDYNGDKQEKDPNDTNEMEVKKPNDDKNSKATTVSSTSSNDEDESYPKPIKEQKPKSINEAHLDKLEEEQKPKPIDEAHIDKLEEEQKQKEAKEKQEIKERNQQKIKNMADKLWKEDQNDKTNENFDRYEYFTKAMENAKKYDEENNTGNETQRTIYNGYINPMIDDGLEAEGRLKLFSSGWTDKTLTRIDELLTQLKKSSGYNIRRQHYALGWTDKTLTRIDELLEQLK